MSGRAPSDVDLVRRAVAAWFRGGGDASSLPVGAVEVHGGLRHVVLRDSRAGAVVAVYRVRHDDVLRRLRRYPAALRGPDAARRRRRAPTGA